MQPLLIVTGELSGELHALRLLERARALAVSGPWFGMGGELLAEAGVKILISTQQMQIIGATGLWRGLSKLWHAWQVLTRFIRERRPKVVVLIDYPDFNLKLAKFAKKHGSKVLFFICPTVWAWRQSRVKILQKYVDVLAVIYPFEVEFLKSFGIAAHYVGNHLLTLVQQHLPRETVRNEWQITVTETVVGLFPGSRASEIQRHLPLLLAAAEQIYQKRKVRFLLPQAKTIREAQITSILAQFSHLPVQVIVDRSYDVMMASDLILAASGTVTLEIALLARPLIILYRGSFLEYLIAKLLLKTPFLGICNILAGKGIAPELLQYEATATRLASLALTWLQDSVVREQQLVAFRELKQTFAQRKTEDLGKLLQSLWQE